MPNSWVDCEIGAIAEVVSGGTPPSGNPANFSNSSGVPWITPADLSGYRNQFISQGARNLTTMGLAACSARLVPSGTVLFSSRAPVGYVAIAGQPVSTNQGFKSFVPAPGIDSRFLYYQLQHLRPIAEAMATGTTFKELSGGNAKRLPIALPPTAEQVRIADKLDRLMEKVEATSNRTNRIRVLTERLRRSIFSAARSGALTKDWREANIRSQDWETAELHTLADVGTGSTPLRSDADFYSEHGTPWVTSSATSQPFVHSASEHVTDAAIAAHRLKKYPPGTLLVAMYGEGKTRGQVTELRLEATINQACAAINVRSERLHPGFLKLVLRAGYFEMRELAEGGNQPNLNLSKIKGLLIPVPGRDEQDLIVQRAEKLLRLVELLESRTTAVESRINALKPALLAKAFCGELVPQDPADEPASVLLERIRSQAPTTPPRKAPTRRKTA